jgi:Ca-activated chloride channel family protein
VSAQDVAGDPPVFKSQVNLVSLAAVVRDKRGRTVPTLTPADFIVRENGKTVPLLELRSDQNAPANIALLVDGSGSMGVGESFAISRDVAGRILASLQPGRDEAALYSFDTRLLTLAAFTPDLDLVRDRLTMLQTWGSTSLYDAIAGVAGKINDRGEARRAIVVFTDGNDTTSTQDPAEVATIASALDVPVYVFALHGQPLVRDGKTPPPALALLAEVTGGLYLTGSDARSLALHAATVIDELRHQHVLAFEASTERGWRSLELSVKGRGLTIRSRGWYWAGATSTPEGVPPAGAAVRR